jgi:hypothetical protein
MLHQHQRSAFPLVLGLLTLALAGFVAWSFLDRAAAPDDAPGRETPAVDENAYRAKTKAAVAEYLDADARAGTDLERLLVAERAIDALLAIRVPAADKDLHFDLISSLSLIRSGLRGDADALSEGRAKLDRTLASAPWLQ